MRKIGMIKAMKACADFRKADPETRAALQARRLEEMISWAREASSFYRNLYKDLPTDCSLSDLPVVDKRTLMANWDSWVTDSGTKLSDVNTFMQNPDNIGRRLKGKYLVFTTSGSTGNPLVALCDSTTNNVMGAINIMRSFARKEDLLSYMKRGGKTIGVFATGGFYLGNSSVRARLLAMPWKKRQMAVTSALLPVHEIVSQLNAFQPAMLGGYPSNLDLLVEEQKTGRLRISPVLIMTGGEYLSDTVRKRLSDAFGCYVQTSYACTEGGTIACECRGQHFHLNDDWVIVEPVDANNQPVPDGTQSDKILLTNLYNFTQPYIRYEVTDRVILHTEPCVCGNSSPWIELEGRTDDVVTFLVDGTTRKVAPLALYATLKEVHTLRRFQLVVQPENSVLMRIEPTEGATRETAFAQATAALRTFLSAHGIDSVSISLSDEPPQQQAGSGKFKHILQAQDALSTPQSP